ncbi:MAG: hypothetical protein PHP08_02910 [Candidatus Dojkabacteria bacterium]|nr:hypothetical protein [Candidatus Dojkabacteria bacterium]
MNADKIEILKDCSISEHNKEKLSEFPFDDLIYRNKEDQLSVFVDPNTKEVFLSQIFTQKRLPEYKTVKSFIRGQIWSDEKSRYYDPVIEELGLDIYFVWVGSKEEYKVYIWQHENPGKVVGLDLKPSFSKDGEILEYRFEASQDDEETKYFIETFENITGFEVSHVLIGSAVGGGSTKIPEENLDYIMVTLK